MREKTISRSVENDEVNPLRVEKESKLIVDLSLIHISEPTRP